MSSFDPAAAGWKQLTGGPLPNGMGVPWAKRHDDGWRYGLQTTAEHANPQGAIHGGVLMTLADHGLSLLVWEAAGRAPSATIQLNTHFLDAVKPGAFLVLRGEITRVTGSMVFVRGLIADEGRDVAAADGVWRIFRRG